MKQAFIRLTPPEIQSGLDRQRWAEGLIRQLPKDHDGRNSWLLNFGVSEEAVVFRDKRVAIGQNDYVFDQKYKALRKSK